MPPFIAHVKITMCTVVTGSLLKVSWYQQLLHFYSYKISYYQFNIHISKNTHNILIKC